MLRAYPPDRVPSFLDAVHRPLAFGLGLAAVEAFVGDGEHADAHEPETRGSMARALSRVIELAAEVPNVDALYQGWAWPDDRLWPEPHNALFDVITRSAFGSRPKTASLCYR